MAPPKKRTPRDTHADEDVAEDVERPGRPFDPNSEAGVPEFERWIPTDPYGYQGPDE